MNLGQSFIDLIIQTYMQRVLEFLEEKKIVDAIPFNIHMRDKSINKNINNKSTSAFN